MALLGCKITIGVIALIAGAAIIGAAPGAHASDIGPSNDVHCAFNLAGEIRAGDHERLSALLARSRLDPLEERTSSLCLHSAGGSFVEGLKIAELIYRSGVSTAVLDGRHCFSACAIIFMAGVMPQRETPFRKLSAGGVLGFHAPYLSMPDRSYSKEQLEGATQGMRMAILALVKLSSKQTQMQGGNFIKKSLLGALLEKGPDEVFFIRTIGDAARWGIEIFDAAVQYPQPNKAEGLKNLCNNFHFSNLDERVPVSAELTLKIDRYVSKFHKDDFRILLENPRSHDTVCEIYVRTFRNIADVSFWACSHDYWSSKSFGDCREYKTAAIFGNPVPSFFTLAPSTPLKKFDGQQGQVR